MKPLFSLLFLTAINFCYGQKVNKHHNKINDLKNSKEVENFLKLINNTYADFKVVENLKEIPDKCRRIYDSLQIRPYEKADFDNNGFKDLLVIGYYSRTPLVLCILDSGNNHFSIERIPSRDFIADWTFPKVIRNKAGVSIKYYTFKYTRYSKITEFDSTQLIYKFGGFIDKSSAPKDYHIEKIEYETTMCFGRCPAFGLIISNDLTAAYNAMKYNNPNGRFTGVIDKAQYKEITSLLNYIDFPSLKDKYSVDWTDDQSCRLIITYDGGKVKTIGDYGLIGTYGLRRAYNLLFDLRKNKGWNKISDVTESAY